MHRFLLSLTLSTLVVSSALGQDRGKKAAPPAGPNNAAASASPSDAPTTVTPEIWYYMQEQRRLDDPKMAIRRAAEYRASQRRARIESSRWFGYSRLRPQASPIPIMGTASPAWVGNNAGNPYYWSGLGRTSYLFVHPSVLYR